MAHPHRLRFPTPLQIDRAVPGRFAVGLSPGGQLAALLGVVAVTALLDLGRPRGVACVAGLAALAVVTTPGALRHARSRVRPLLFCAVGGLVLLRLVPPAAGADLLWLPGWRQPVDAAAARLLLAFWVKAGLLVAWATAAAATLDEQKLLAGLRALRLPPLLASLGWLMIHNLAWVGDEVRRLVRARDARGPTQGWRAVRVAAALASTLLWHLGRRAEIQALALTARGYRGELASGPAERPRPAELTGILAATLALWALSRW